MGKDAGSSAGPGAGPRSARFLPPLGQSERARELDRQIARAAGCDAKVLITGETGAGKEVVAERLHVLSRRAHAPFVTVHCAALSDTLLESELFGHTRGSFTDATSDRTGSIAAAHGGTVLFDEVGAMSPRMQGLLLRFLQSGEVQKIGALRPERPVDVRVLAATNCALDEMVASGAFREDLFYRLNVCPIHVPPLRERTDDIPVLVEHLLQRFTDGGTPLIMTAAMIASLQAYAWPGNVRELETWVQRYVVAARHQQPAPLVSSLEPARGAAPAPVPPGVPVERRRTVAASLYDELTRERRPFWTTVHTPFMRREITRDDLRALVSAGLTEVGGNYKSLTRLFQIPEAEYKKFLDFLRKHDCRLPYRDFRLDVRRPRNLH